MTPPGDALEFAYGPSFERAERKAAGLREAVEKYYREHPEDLLQAGGGPIASKIFHGGRDYEVLVIRRNSNRVNFLTASESAIPKKDLEYFLKKYARGGRK